MLAGPLPRKRGRGVSAPHRPTSGTGGSDFVQSRRLISCSCPTQQPSGRARLRRPRGSVRRKGAARECVAPADDAARVTSRQEEPLRASAWPASPTDSGAQRRRGRERWPSGQVKARGQRGVAAATRLRLRPELRSHRLSSRSQISLRGGAAESGGLPGRCAGARRRRATWSCSLSGGGRTIVAGKGPAAGRASPFPTDGRPQGEKGGE